MPALPMVAATSANHLAGLDLPAGCARLYIAADADAAGRHGIERLSRRVQARPASLRSGASSAARRLQRRSAPPRPRPSRGMAARSARPGGRPSLSARPDERPATGGGRAADRRREGLQAWRGPSGEAAPAACQRGDPCHAPVTAATAAPSSASLRPSVRPRPGRGRGALSGREGRGHNRRRHAMTDDLPFDDGYEPYPRLLADRPRHPRAADVRPPSASGRAGSAPAARRRR